MVRRLRRGVLSRELKTTMKLFLIWEKNQARRMGRSLLLVLLISKVISKTMLKMFMPQTLIRIEPLLRIRTRIVFPVISVGCSIT